MRTPSERMRKWLSVALALYVVAALLALASHVHAPSADADRHDCPLCLMRQVVGEAQASPAASLEPPPLLWSSASFFAPPLRLASATILQPASRGPPA